MSEVATTRTARVFAGKLHRVRQGRRTAFATMPPPSRPPVRRPARVAVMLALAHKIEDAIDRGAVRDRAEVARRLGFTRARVTQLQDLTLLAPDIQEALLELESVDGVEPLCEFKFRVLAHAGTWDDALTLLTGSLALAPRSARKRAPAGEIGTRSDAFVLSTDDAPDR